MQVPASGQLRLGGERFSFWAADLQPQSVLWGQKTFLAVKKLVCLNSVTVPLMQWLIQSKGQHLCIKE